MDHALTPARQEHVKRLVVQACCEGGREPATLREIRERYWHRVKKKKSKINKSAAAAVGEEASVELEELFRWTFIEDGPHAGLAFLDRHPSYTTNDHAKEDAEAERAFVKAAEVLVVVWRHHLLDRALLSSTAKETLLAFFQRVWPRALAACRRLNNAAAAATASPARRRTSVRVAVLLLTASAVLISHLARDDFVGLDNSSTFWEELEHRVLDHHDQDVVSGRDRENLLVGALV
jgi:hypothetical protein